MIIVRYIAPNLTPAERTQTFAAAQAVDAVACAQQASRSDTLRFMGVDFTDPDSETAYWAAWDEAAR